MMWVALHCSCRPRSAGQKAHLDLFIDNLLGFSFHTATSLEDVVVLIRNSCGVETTTSSLLDLSNLQLQAGET